MTNRRSNQTTYAYATAPDRFTVTRPGNAHTTYQTDSAGRPASITEDVDATHQRTTGLDWDTDNNLAHYTEASGTTQAATTTLGHDALGDLTSVTDPNGHTTTLTYGYGTEDGTSVNGTGYVSDLATVRYPRDTGIPGNVPPPTVTFGVDAHGNVTTRQYRGQTASTIGYPTPNLGLPSYEIDEAGN